MERDSRSLLPVVIRAPLLTLSRLLNDEGTSGKEHPNEEETGIRMNTDKNEVMNWVWMRIFLLM